MSAKSALDLYLSSQTAVEGWLDPYSAEVIAELGRFQAANRIAGSVGEIGVHHGRLFILLRLLRRPREQSVAIDVFENQDLNVDSSGRGDLAKFKANVERWSGGEDLIVIERSSLNVTPKELIDKAGQFRLFSVDGGHTEECAYNDLSLAEAVLAENGVIILDDFSNHHWPSVAAGAARFFLDGATRARPFATSPNKMYIALPDHHAEYRKALHASQAAHFYRSCSMFGHQVDIYERRRSGGRGRLAGVALKIARRARRYLRSARA
jgi:hypothetical protein